MRPTTDVSSANLMMWLELNLAVQSWVSSVKSSGLSTQPCGAPVLSVVVLEVLWPTRTDWGLPVKKSRIQLQRELLRPSRLNLLMSCCGIIVLNAELKSMNSILTYESANICGSRATGCRPLHFGYHNSWFYHDSLSCWFLYFASCLSITAKLISLL